MRSGLNIEPNRSSLPLIIIRSGLTATIGSAKSNYYEVGIMKIFQGQGKHQHAVLYGLALLFVVGCGGGDSPPGEIKSVSVSKTDLFLTSGETESVTLFKKDGTIGTNFSEVDHDVNITVSDCQPPAQNCQIWANTPGLSARDGSHIVEIGYLESADANGILSPVGNYSVNKVSTGLLGKASAINLYAGTYSSTAYVRLSDGSLVGWGEGVGSKEQLDQQIFPHFKTTLPRAMVFDIANVQAVYPSQTHTLVLDNTNHLHAFGLNDQGQLGNNSGFAESEHTVPVFLNAASAVSTGQAFSLAVVAGRVMAWGENTDGQLGIGRRSHHERIPVQTSDLTDVVQVAAGQAHSLALKSDSTVWGWGSNANLQIAQTGGADYLTPQLIQGLPGSISTIAAGTSHSLALSSDGTVWGWGLNHSGQLGISSSSSAQPVQIPGISNCTAIAAGPLYSMALCNGEVYTWGNGSLGRTATEQSPSNFPHRVTALSGVTHIAAGFNYAMAIRGDCSQGGSVWAWGSMASTGRGSADSFLNAELPAPVPGLGDVGSCTTKRIWIYKTGEGNGTLASDIGNLDCNDFFCWVDVIGSPPNITLTATPDANSVFNSWRWDCPAATINNSTTVDFSTSRLCKAVFDRSPDMNKLTINVTGSGNVTSNPAGIDCGSDCTESYLRGTAVFLTVTPAPGFRFTSISGTGCTGEGILIDRDRTCTVTFSPINTNGFTLTVLKSGEGTGTVRNGVGIGQTPTILCGTDCSETFPAGTSSYLDERADPGFIFSHYDGCDSVERLESGTFRCHFTMNAARTVTAFFHLGQ